MKVGDTAGDRLMALILTETDADSDTIDAIVTELRNVEAEARQAERGRIDERRLTRALQANQDKTYLDEANHRFHCGGTCAAAIAAEYDALGDES